MLNPKTSRLLADLEAQAKGDPAAAEVYLDALERHLRAVKYVTFFEPHVGQQRFWDRLRPEQKIWILLGGNRAGKTAFGCWLDTVWLLGKDYFQGASNWKWIEPLPIPPGPVNVRIVSLVLDQLRDPIWEKLTAHTEHPPFFPQDGSIMEINNSLFHARFKNGARLSGKSAETDPKKHGASSCDLVHIDEECSGAIFDENYQRTISKSGKILVTATPLDDPGTSFRPWLYDLVEKCREGDPTIGVTYMTALENPYTPEDEKRKLVTKWAGHPEERARLYGEFVRRSGLYYKQWRFEAPLWEPACDIPRDAFRCVVIDPAVTGTVGALWAAFDGRGNMTIYRTYKKAGLPVSTHVENILTENRGDAIDLWLCDPWMGRQSVPNSNREHKTVLQIWRDAGLPRLRLADVDYEVALAASHEYIKAAADSTDPHPRLTVFDYLEDWAEEMRNYVIDAVAQGPRRGELRDRPRKGNSTLMECYQYLAGMRLRYRRNTASALPPAARRSYFADGDAARQKPPWGREPW